MAQAISNTLYNSLLSTKPISTKAKQTLGQNIGLNSEGKVYLKNQTAAPAPLASTPSTGSTQSFTNSTPSTVNIQQLLNQIKDRALQLQAQQQPTKQPKPEKPVKGLFSSVVDSLMKTGPSDSQSRYMEELASASRGGLKVGQDARAIAEKYGGEIARIGQLGAGAQAGALSTGTGVVGRGNAAIASQSASQRMNALAAGLGAELQGTQQQLSAQDQLIAGLTSALGSADTQQAQAIQAMINAGTLAQPQVAQFGQTVFDPTTGSFQGAGGNLDPQVQAQQLAQAVINGQMTYDQALSSLSYAGGVGTNFLNNAITGMGGNPLQLQAQSGAAQTNIGTAGTAQTNIAYQGLNQATQDYVQMQSAAQFADDQARAVSDILEKSGLNSISSTDYNKVLRRVQERLSDADRVALETALIEARAAYTQLLSLGGGTPSGREAQALDTLNMDHSASAINASIKQLEAAVARRLQAQYSAMQTFQSNLGGGGGMSGGNPFAEEW